MRPLAVIAMLSIFFSVHSQAWKLEPDSKLKFKSVRLEVSFDPVYNTVHHTIFVSPDIQHYFQLTNQLILINRLPYRFSEFEAAFPSLEDEQSHTLLFEELQSRLMSSNAISGRIRHSAGSQVTADSQDDFDLNKLLEDIDLPSPEAPITIPYFEGFYGPIPNNEQPDDGEKNKRIEDNLDSIPLKKKEFHVVKKQSYKWPYILPVAVPLSMLIYRTYEYISASERPTICNYLPSSRHHPLFQTCRYMTQEYEGIGLPELSIMRHISKNQPALIRVPLFQLRSPENPATEVNESSHPYLSELQIDYHFLNFYTLPIERKAYYFRKLHHVMSHIGSDNYRVFLQLLPNLSAINYQLVEVVLSFITALEEFRNNTTIGNELIPEDSQQEYDLISHLILSFNPTTLKDRCTPSSLQVISDWLTTPTLICD